MCLLMAPEIMKWR